MNTTAQVYLREEKRTVTTAVSAPQKPEPGDGLLQKWQKLIDTVARIYNVPAGLIMKITPERMQVVLASRTADNPYQPSASDSLGHGLYCETVIGRRAPLHIADSLALPDWEENPDIKLNMISYLGMPLSWPDGEAYGTICVLDRVKREYSSDYFELLEQFKLLIEADLERLLYTEELEHARSLHDLRLREISHRVKNQFNIIASLVQLRGREAGGDTRQVLQEIEGKLHAVSQLHNRIYRSEDFTISTGQYLQDVLTAAVELRGLDTAVHTDFACELPLREGQLFQFGMLLSELVNNTLKYGLTGQEGRISLSITPGRDGDVVLRYSDNGPGFPPEILSETGKHGLGTLIISHTAAALNSSVKQYNCNGAVTELTIPVAL